MQNNNTFFKIILQNVKREWSWKRTGLTGIHEACLSIQQNQMLKLAAICKIWRSRHFWIHKNNYISTVIVYGKDCHKFSNFNEFIAFQWYENCWYPDLVLFLFNLRWKICGNWMSWILSNSFSVLKKFILLRIVHANLWQKLYMNLYEGYLESI